MFKVGDKVRFVCAQDDPQRRFREGDVGTVTAVDNVKGIGWIGVDEGSVVICELAVELVDE